MTSTHFPIQSNGRDFRQRRRFSPTSEIFANVRDFRERPRFSRTAEIFANGRDFRERPRFSPTAEIFANGTAEPGSAEPEKNPRKKFAGRRPANFFRVRLGRTGATVEQESAEASGLRACRASVLVLPTLLFYGRFPAGMSSRTKVARFATSSPPGGGQRSQNGLQALYRSEILSI